MRISDWSSDVCSSDLQLAFGPGQLGGDTSVSIASVAQDDLALPPPNAEYFDFVAAFDLSIEGDDVDGPLQIAAPVSADVGAPGDKVYFFQKQTIRSEERRVGKECVSKGS